MNTAGSYLPSPVGPNVDASAPAHLCDAGTGERHDHGHHVDGQLELQELGDAVVDVPSPHDGLDDAGEVVVRQDDVGRLLRHVGASDSLTRSRGRACDTWSLV